MPRMSGNLHQPRPSPRIKMVLARWTPVNASPCFRTSGRFVLEFECATAPRYALLGVASDRSPLPLPARPKGYTVAPGTSVRETHTDVLRQTCGALLRLP